MAMAKDEVLLLNASSLSVCCNDKVAYQAGVETFWLGQDRDAYPRAKQKRRGKPDPKRSNLNTGCAPVVALFAHYFGTLYGYWRDTMNYVQS